MIETSDKWNLFKVNIKDTKMTSDFTHFSGISIDDFEQVNAG